LVYYDNAIEVIDKDSIELISLFEDKAKIKQNQENYDEAVQILQDAVQIAEKK
jgi:hypothetical protein